MNFKKLLVTSLLSLLCNSSLSAQNWRPYEGTPQQQLKNGKPEEALRMMKSNPKWIRSGDRLGQKPMHYAAGLGSIGLARWLLQNGAEIDAKARDSRTALFFAKTSEMAELLLEEGANINAMNRRGETALFAVENSSVVRMLLDHGADLDAADINGETPLFQAASVELASLLIRRQANLNHRNNLGETVLQSVTSDLATIRLSQNQAENIKLKELTQLAKVFIKAGVNYDVVSAIRLGDVERVRTCLNSEAEVDLEGYLFEAVDCGQTEICKIFVSRLGKVDRGLASIRSEIAIESLKHPAILDLLIRNGLDVNAKVSVQGSGWSGLHLIGGNEATLLHFVQDGESAGILLDAGADPFAEAESWSVLNDDISPMKLMPLDVAMWEGNSSATLAIIQHSAFRECAAMLGQEKITEYFFSSFGRENSTELVDAFVELGADPKIEFNGYTAFEANWYSYELFESKGDSRNAECHRVAKALIDFGLEQDLMTAIMLGDKEAVQAFSVNDVELGSQEMEDLAIGNCVKERQVDLLALVLGCCVEKPNPGPLSWAAAMGQRRAVQLLIHHGADVNERHERGLGRTPLHFAVAAKHREIVEMLLEHGADPTIKDKSGLIAIEHCKTPARRVELQSLFDKFKS